MKVKEFDTYRAPRRKPWGALVALLLLGMGVYWFFVREKPEPRTDRGTPPAGVDAAGSGEAGSGEAVPAVVEPAPVALPANVSMLMDTAGQLMASDKLVEARLKYLEALRNAQDPAVQRQIETRLAPVSIALVLSPRPMPEKEDYVVRSGDSLGAIATRFGTTSLLIQTNNLVMNPNRIKVGDRLRVFTGKFELQANKTTHEMVVLMNGEFFKRYKVGTGVFGRTPVGSFVVRDKIAEPTWWPPDGREVPFGHKDNILGTRWMSVRATGDTPDVRGYGIHGTWAPDSVGKASSAGCLRMINEQVEELFVYIPAGTPLRISE
jgi:lipoprotein-anchoring transpeptidase ErfK/SrfK